MAGVYEAVTGWFGSNFGSLWASLGGSLVLSLALARWVADRAASRLELHWSNQVTQELEKLRFELSERRDDLSAIRQALSVGHSASHAKIVQAIEELWQSVLQIREFTGRMTVVYDMLVAEEFDDVGLRDELLSMVPEYTNQAFHEQVLVLSSTVESFRPFLGESLWRKYYVYRAVSLRLAWKTHRGKQLKHIRMWDRDEKGNVDHAMLELFHSALGKEQVERLAAFRFGAPRALLDAMELRMLEDINEWLFGRRMATLTAENIRAVRKLTDSSVLGEETPKGLPKM